MAHSSVGCPLAEGDFADQSRLYPLRILGIPGWHEGVER
jgi:hypothetical protein